jgi:hypothetical protein
VTLRPTWSTTNRRTTALRSRVGLFLATAMMIGGCSDLDPNIGPRRIEPEEDVIEDAGEPADGESTDGDNGKVDPGGVSFKNDIRPLMNRPGKGDPTGRGCKSCHYRTETSHLGIDFGGLDLTTLGSLRLGGGSSGRRIVVAGKPAESVIIQVLKGQYPYASRMPKNGMPYWSDAEVGIVETWISQGAKGADDE